MLAIIPARGGSKGIPDKNIALLAGKPLIAHTIEAAQAARSVDRIILSTDSMKIAQVAQSYGIEIPFMRPVELSGDNALAIDNYLYTVARLNQEVGADYHEFIVLLPTSPLRTAEDIDSAVEIYHKNSADSVISCVLMDQPPFWAKKISDDGRIESVFDINISNKNRQEYMATYTPNGAVFILKYNLLKDRYSYYSEKTYAYVMPRERSVDIDTQLDLEWADFLINKRVLNSARNITGGHA